LGHGDLEAAVKDACGGRVLFFSACFLAWFSSLILALPSATLDASLEGVNRTALAWLPWLLVMGLPRGGSRPEDLGDWKVGLALALPVVGLVAWCDGRAGLEPAILRATGLLGLLLCIAWGEGARRAARADLAWYGPLWLVLCLAAPTLAAALEWASRGALTAGSFAETLARLSPLGALSLRAAAFAPHGAEIMSPALLSAGLTLVAVTLAAGARRGSSAHEE